MTEERVKELYATWRDLESRTNWSDGFYVGVLVVAIMWTCDHAVRTGGLSWAAWVYIAVAGFTIGLSVARLRQCSQAKKAWLNAERELAETGEDE